MNFRRYYIPNAIVFITTVVHRREPIFADELYVDLLRTTLHNTKKLHPFHMLGYVFLPDHIHLLIRPTGESNFSKIMHSAKSYFVYAYKQMLDVPGRMQFWQKRFYDHLIRDEDDFANHLHYIHYNPVKHKYVTRPEDWPYSSYVAWQAKGLYPEQWGWALPESIASLRIEDAE